MNEGKSLHVRWETFTREELRAELARLQAENTRLTALMPAAVPLRHKPADARSSDGRQESAREILTRLSNVTFRSPRSILPMWLLSIFARWASDS
ncbi:hypothetical protein ABD05_25170 [Burkholderia pyrrocinia]|nr:hypothetical protein ABD05_25170 [Burkholderia pyrrocinia]